MTHSSHTNDEDAAKGALEQDRRRGQKTNVSMRGQNPHRDQDPLLKASDTDFPEPGNNEEHTGEPRAEAEPPTESAQPEPIQRVERELNPEGLTQDQDPGSRQKQNQNQQKDDPLAA